MTLPHHGPVVAIPQVSGATQAAILASLMS
jgi:hypothetical protein